MTEAEAAPILTISLMAALADGGAGDRERDELKRIAEGLTAESSVNVTKLYQDVLLKRVSLASTAASIESPDAKQLAFEMAVCVCDADDVQSEREKRFLEDLRGALGLPKGEADAFVAQAEAMAAEPLAIVHAPPPPIPVGAKVATAATAAGAAATAAGMRPSTMTDAELDRSILNTSILNGALELLPQSLSTMAIIPLQMKLVYSIGKSYGYTLDKGHIKDFLATVGVGLTSQYVEEVGRKFLGGLLGKFVGKGIGGKLAKGIGKQAVSSGMSFASTYALGHIAKRYYAGGRTMSTQVLKDSFASMLGEAQKLQSTYLPQMQSMASTLTPSKVMEAVRA